VALVLDVAQELGALAVVGGDGEPANHVLEAGERALVAVVASPRAARRWSSHRTSSAAVGVWATSTRPGAVGGSPIAAAVALASSSARRHCSVLAGNVAQELQELGRLAEGAGDALEVVAAVLASKLGTTRSRARPPRRGGYARLRDNAKAAGKPGASMCCPCE
jgi:hypothetical protein